MLLLFKILFLILVGRYFYMNIRMRPATLLGKHALAVKIARVLFYTPQGGFSLIQSLVVVNIVVGVLTPSVDVLILASLLQATINVSQRHGEVKRIQKRIASSRDFLKDRREVSS